MVDVVITSAGKGRRMGDVEKQFLPLNGIPLFIYSLRTFASIDEIEKIILVLPEGKQVYGKHLVSEFEMHREIIVVPGGNERQDSVYAGLKEVKSDIVLIHDGVRPFVSSYLIQKIIREVERYGAVIPAIPISDTIKRVEKNQIIATLNRDEIFAVQTPQGFEREIIQEAYEVAYRDKFYATDDSMLVERLGIGVRIIDGEPLNIKITRKEDFYLAEEIAKKLEQHYH